MSRRVVGACVLTILCGGAMPAFAQSGHKVGLVMGYPTAAGVLWHVSDGIALRPDFSISRQRIETTSTAILGTINQTFDSSTETWNTSVGLSALFYLGPPEDLRLYLTPRVAWLSTRTSAESSTGAATLGPRNSDADGIVVSGAFGAQYRLSDRFRVFGELGLAYTDQDENAELSGLSSKTSMTGFGLRSGVGVVVYF